EAFASRAYRDMNRTLHGIAAEDKDHKIFKDALKKVTGFFSGLNRPAVPVGDALRRVFDDWQGKSCQTLCQYYKEAIHDKKAQMKYGQAQKWLNMTFKYGWVCGDHAFD